MTDIHECSYEGRTLDPASKAIDFKLTAFSCLDGIRHNNKVHRNSLFQDGDALEPILALELLLGAAHISKFFLKR